MPPLFSLDNISSKEVIGSGAYGKVYKITLKEDSEKFYAVKKIKDTSTSVIVREISFAKTVSNHSSFVKTHKVNIKININDESECAIFMDYFPLTLDNLIKNDEKLNKKKFIRVAYQLISGLFYIEQLGLMHRDIKENNILYDPNKVQAKFCDFGLCSTVKRKCLTPNMCTLHTRAPEILIGDHYSIESDIWSLGIVLYQVYTGKRLFWIDNKNWSELKVIKKINSLFDTDFFDKVVKSSGEKNFNILEENIDDIQVIDLLKKMLVVDPSKRSCASELLSNPLFVNLKSKIFPKQKIRKYMTVNSNGKINNQKNIDFKHYNILVSWLGELSPHINMLDFPINKMTLIISIDILNRYIASKNIVREKFQGIGAACLYISCLIIEEHIPAISNFIYVCDSLYTNKEFIELVEDIIIELKFDFIVGYTYNEDKYTSFEDLVKDMFNHN